jgi:hypothetical protein
MKRGAPQGSVIAATLFRLYIHFLPSYFDCCNIHLFADDLALVLNGSLDLKFLKNIHELERKAEKVMKQLEKFSDDMVLPVNISKTKVMLVHNIVSPKYPRIEYKSQPIEFVKKYKYLGVTISTKLGWEIYLNERLRKISRIYNAMRIAFRLLRKKDIITRKKIFSAFALPHFLWIFCIWFFLTERQRERISHLYCHGLRIVHNLPAWDDFTTLVLSKEKSLTDYLFSYWRRLMHHMLSANEALAFQMTWSNYLIVTSNEKNIRKNLGVRINSVFFNRLRDQIKHCIIEWMEFDSIHMKQYEIFKRDDSLRNQFIYKFFLQIPESTVC